MEMPKLVVFVVKGYVAQEAEKTGGTQYARPKYGSER